MVERKTFLFITDTDYKHGKLTGAHKRFLELIKGLSKGNDIILVSEEIPQLLDEKIKHIKIKKKKSLLPAHINRILVLSKVLRKEKGNIKYDYAVSFGPADTICYRRSGYNNIVTLFRENFMGYKKITGATGVKLWYFKLMEKCTVKYSEKIIVQCEDDKRALIERYGKNVQSKIYVQINNINASWIIENKVQMVKKNNNLVKIAFVGNFSDNRKGQQLLLPAIAKLIDEGYKIELRLAGDGRQLNAYKDKYNKYKNIIFLGRTEKINDLLAESDFEIVPSLMDSCPNTVLEGINAGIAVYGTNIGGIKDILQDTQFLFEPTVDSVYMFIKNILDKSRYMEDAGIQEAIKKKLTFDWAKKIERIIKQGKYESRK